MKIQEVMLLGSLLTFDLASAKEEVEMSRAVGSDNDEVKSNEQHLPGIPRLIQTPPLFSYVAPQKWVLIRCVAAPANYVNFFCNDKMVARLKLKQDTVQVGGVSQISFYVNVTFNDVHEWFGQDGDYWCLCEAWNTVPNMGPKMVRSAKAFVKLTYLEERFQFSPMSKRVEAKSDSLLVMQCVPPLGQPSPEVFWEKNGERVKISNRYTIDHQASLIIKPVHLLDTGNYTCVAKNAAGRLVSEVATIDVFKNGAWSSWTEWSDVCPDFCSAGNKCVRVCRKVRQERDRTCSAPGPGNGGENCKGQSMQTRGCDDQCDVDGWWSKWSDWSACNHNCHQISRRSCNRPKPKNKGLDCEGSHFHLRNCTDVNCDQYLAYQITTLPTKIVEDFHDVSMYIGLSFSVIVLLVVIVVFVYLMKQKFRRFTNRNIHFSNHVDGENGNVGMKSKKHMYDVLSQPDLTKSALALANKSDVQHMLASDSHLNTSSTLVISHPTSHALPQLPIYQTNGAADERATPYIIGASTSSGVSLTSVETKCSCKDVCAGDMVSGIKPRPCSALYHEPIVGMDRHNQFFTKLVAGNNIDAKDMAWGTVCEDGGRLYLPQSGISLTIPPGSLPHGQSEEFFLAVCRDNNELPRLSERQAVLSPIILCGPSGIASTKEFVISFPHSACLKQGFWSITLLSSDSVSNDYITWKEMVTLGQETLLTPSFCQLDINQCHLMTDQLQRYCLIGQSMEGGNAVKQLCIAAFATPVHRCMDYIVRVYILADTRDAFEHVVSLESQNRGCLLGTKKQLLFRDGGHNLCLLIEDLSSGWNVRVKHQEIHFQSIWSGNQSGKLHCSFPLEQIDLALVNVSCKIVVYQNNFFSNRQIVEVLSETIETTQTSANVLFNVISKVAPPSQDDRFLQLPKPLQSPFRLPNHLKLRLCHLLDIPNSRGNDWRMLARQLGVDRYANFFAVKTSPTDCILNLWEARNREDSALRDLSDALCSMNRIDCASLIDSLNH